MRSSLNVNATQPCSSGESENTRTSTTKKHGASDSVLAAFLKLSSDNNNTRNEHRTGKRGRYCKNRHLYTRFAPLDNHFPLSFFTNAAATTGALTPPINRLPWLLYPFQYRISLVSHHTKGLEHLHGQRVRAVDTKNGNTHRRKINTVKSPKLVCPHIPPRG